MKTNSKVVTEKVKAHVLEYFTQEDLKSQVESMTYKSQTSYMIGQELVMGGCFLIYHTEVAEFLNGLDINPEGKEYDSQKSWDLYKHMVAKQVEKLVEIK